MIETENVAAGSEWSGESDLPRWDLTVLYPGLESSEFKQGMADLASFLAELQAQTPFHRDEPATS